MLLLYRAIACGSALHGLAFRVAGEAFSLMGKLTRLPAVGIKGGQSFPSPDLYALIPQPQGLLSHSHQSICRKLSEGFQVPPEQFHPRTPPFHPFLTPSPLTVPIQKVAVGYTDASSAVVSTGQALTRTWAPASPGGAQRVTHLALCHWKGKSESGGVWGLLTSPLLNTSLLVFPA